MVCSRCVHGLRNSGHFSLPVDDPMVQASFDVASTDVITPRVDGTRAADADSKITQEHIDTNRPMERMPPVLRGVTGKMEVTGFEPVPKPPKSPKTSEVPVRSPRATSWLIGSEPSQPLLAGRRREAAGPARSRLRRDPRRVEWRPFGLPSLLT